MKTLAYISLFMVAVMSQQVLACKLAAGVEYKKPTESERFSEADLVFDGSIEAMEEAPSLDGVRQLPNTYIYTVKVKRWLKGSGQNSIQVIDNVGTDCDPYFGVLHFLLEPSALPSHGWRMFARKEKGRIWIITTVYKN